MRIDILRPGSYEALVDHLEAAQERHGAGFYHVIHFDVHGAVASLCRIGADRDRLAPRLQGQIRRPLRARPGHHPQYPPGEQGLSLPRGQRTDELDPVEAGELADLLINHQIPIAILNACQSGKQDAARPIPGPAPRRAWTTTDPPPPRPAWQPADGRRRADGAGHGLLGHRQRGRELMMARLYARALRRRPAGRGHPPRPRWSSTTTRGAAPTSTRPSTWRTGCCRWSTRTSPRSCHCATSRRRSAPPTTSRQARRYRAPTVTYGFVGRDLDILQVEQAAADPAQPACWCAAWAARARPRCCTTWAGWWQTTGFVDQVFYFGYDERAWTRQQIMDAMARAAAGRGRLSCTTFQPLRPGRASRRCWPASCARSRHLLILDNLESITGTHLAIRNTLPEDGAGPAAAASWPSWPAGARWCCWARAAARAGWPPGTFGDNVYDLPGLDPEAASDPGRPGPGAPRRRPTTARTTDFARLLKLLDGYPLPIEVVLANLAQPDAGARCWRRWRRARHWSRPTMTRPDGSKTEQHPALHRLLPRQPVAGGPGAAALPGPLHRRDQPATGCRSTPSSSSAQPALADLPFDRWEEVLAGGGGLGPARARTPRSATPCAPAHLPLLPAQPAAGPSRTMRSRDRDRLSRALRRTGRRDAPGCSRPKEAQEKQIGPGAGQLEYENLQYRA